jgi:hypothetical protein
MRKWLVMGVVPVALGGLWFATQAQANPLFGSGHHDNGSGVQSSGSLSMRSHTDVMQQWTGSGDGYGSGTGTGGGAVGGENAGGAAVTQDTSTNWAGYVDTGGRFTSVSANWTQPTAQCGADQTFSSFWVGIDGDGTGSVEQTGSEADCNGGTALYFGWFEMFPAAPVEYIKPVAAGDAMSASVTTDGNGNFTLTLTDRTQGWNEVTDQTSQTAQLGSAEVIAEAPSSQNGVLPLTNFGTASFTGAEANGAPIGSSSGSTTELTMVSGAGALEATPSALNAAEDFSVTWNSE